jgi:hypothetical protein
MWACRLSKTNPQAMREGWELYVGFVGENPGVKMSFCAAECYAWWKVRDVRDEETAFAWRRGVDFWA